MVILGLERSENKYVEFPIQNSSNAITQGVEGSRMRLRKTSERGRERESKME